MQLKTSVTYLMIHVPYSNLPLPYIRYSIEQIVKALNGSTFSALTGVIGSFHGIIRSSVSLLLNLLKPRGLFTYQQF
jgi:hypothetical protein